MLTYDAVTCAKCRQHEQVKPLRQYITSEEEINTHRVTEFRRVTNMSTVNCIWGPWGAIGVDIAKWRNRAVRRGPLAVILRAERLQGAG
jgi:hypothetical protein